MPDQPATTAPLSLATVTPTLLPTVEGRDISDPWRVWSYTVDTTLPDGSPILIFEGTYTMQFANHPAPTPRYDYNQILYRLDLDDPRLEPAQKK